MADVEKIAQAVGTRVAGFLQESDGSKSSSRLCIVLVVIFTLGFVTALLWRIHGPIAMSDFTAAVAVMGKFCAGICTALYGINRFAECLDNRADGPKPEGE